MRLHSLDAFLKMFNIEIDYNMPDPNKPETPERWVVASSSSRFAPLLDDIETFESHRSYQRHFKKIQFVKDNKSFFMWEEQ